MESNNRPILQWGHPQLQKIFEELPASGALLLVAPDADVAQMLWGLSERSVLPSAQRAGLNPCLVTWQDKNPDEWLNLVTERASDLAILDLRMEVQIEDAFASLERWPCALIALVPQIPDRWAHLFEVCLHFSQDAVMVLGARVQGMRRWSIEWQRKASLQNLPSTTRPRVSLRGFSPARREALVKAFPDIDWGDENRSFVAADAAIIVGQGADTHWRPQVEEAARSCLTIVAFDTGYREDDRVAAYESGASYVLPPQFSNRELGAMLRTHAKHVHTAGRSELDDELETELKRFRRGKSWGAGQEEQITGHYTPLLALQHRKAAAEGRVAGLIVIRIPKVPKELVGTKWDNLLGNLYVDHISANLRKNDSAFIYHQSIVILSHNVNQFSAAAIHRRLQLLATEVPVPLPEVYEMAQTEDPAAFLQSALRRI